MALDADTLLDRMQLKHRLNRWRSLTIAIAALSVALLLSDVTGIKHIGSDYIARVTIDDIILDDTKMDDLLKELAEDPHAKAVLVRFDTPGGTAVGGQELYLAMREISKHKPVIGLMRTLCASAGYMAAIGTDYLLAREGSVVGSIGVIMQTVEMTELAKTLGITPVTIKSGANKATPNPLEKMDDNQRDIIEGVVKDFHQYFVNLVAERRSLDAEALAPLVDGRIFTGKQALEAKLIDAIGAEKEALEWLEENREIKKDLEIRDVKPKKDVTSLLGQLEQMVSKTIFSIKKPFVTLDGLLLIWQPAAQH